MKHSAGHPAALELRASVPIVLPGGPDLRGLIPHQSAHSQCIGQDVGQGMQ